MKRFPIWLPDDVLAEVKKAAEWKGLSASAYICQIITADARQHQDIAAGRTQLDAAAINAGRAPK